MLRRIWDHTEHVSTEWIFSAVTEICGTGFLRRTQSIYTVSYTHLPETYEIGMSNLGMRILYGVFNEMEGTW